MRYRVSQASEEGVTTMAGRWELDHGCTVGYRVGTALVLGRTEQHHPQEMMKPRNLEIGYFRHLQVYRKVPLQESRGCAHQVLGVRWANAKRADGTRRTGRGWLSTTPNH